MKMQNVFISLIPQYSYYVIVSPLSTALFENSPILALPNSQCRINVRNSM